MSDEVQRQVDAEVHLSACDLARLSEHVELTVTADPLSDLSYDIWSELPEEFHLSVDLDYADPSCRVWTASVPELGVSVTSFGVEDTLDRLAEETAARALEIISNPDMPGRERLLPLAIRVWADHRLARLTGTLGEMATVDSTAVSAYGHE